MRSVSRKHLSKAVFFMVLIIALSVLSGCGEPLEDTNGDSTDLQTITLDDLGSGVTRSSSSNISIISTRTNTTILAQYEDIDVDTLVRSGGNTSGILNLMATDLDAGQTLIIDCNVTVDAGNVAIVIAQEGAGVIYEFKIGESDTCTIVSDADNRYFVRMGAESFTGKIELKRTIQ